MAKLLTEQQHAELMARLALAERRVVVAVEALQRITQVDINAGDYAQHLASEAITEMENMK